MYKYQAPNTICEKPSVVTTRHVPKIQEDPGRWICRIQNPGPWCFAFILPEILKNLDPARERLPLDSTNFGSQPNNLSLDSVDPETFAYNLWEDAEHLGPGAHLWFCSFFGQK